MSETHSRRPRPRVIVAGGGVGALEAVLALRELLGAAVAIDLVAPHAELVYRPLAVAEPFGFAPARRLPFHRLIRTHAIRHVTDMVEAVDPGRRRVRLGGGEWRDYDALIMAVGGRARAWLPGAVDFGGGPDVAAYRTLLEDVRSGRVERIAFAAATGPSWPLPLYELALLTAAWAAENCADVPELDLVTPETVPLAAFGRAAGRAVRDLLGDRGVRLHAGTRAIGFDGVRLELEPGQALATDRVVALPELDGPAIPGLPADENGFLPVGEHGAVPGADGVWAVGDGTDRPVKMGGLAAQQADVAAAAIARGLGSAAHLELPPPETCAILLTGVASAYLRARLDGEESNGEVAFNPLWMPPAKVAGRYLAPYLVEHAGVVATPVLAERAPLATEPEQLHEPEAIRELALTLARDDAAHGEYRSALRWLQTVEWLDGGSSGELADLRRRWDAGVKRA